MAALPSLLRAKLRGVTLRCRPLASSTSKTLRRRASDAGAVWPDRVSKAQPLEDRHLRRWTRPVLQDTQAECLLHRSGMQTK
jgi:hypothetical protein